MVKFTSKGAYAEAKMLYNTARRTKKPKVIVEGDFDCKVLQRICNKKLIDVRSYDWDSSDKKGDLINLVKKLDDLSKGKDFQNFVVGVVDADYDGILDRLYDDSKLLPYAENIFDTSLFTDMNLLLISDLSLEKYLSDESLSVSDINNVVTMVRFFGALRTVKKRYEDNHKKRYKQKRDYKVHIPLSDLRKKIVQNKIKTPQNIGQLVEELEEISPPNTKRFFEDIRKTDRLEKVLNRFAKESIDFHQYINGHDLSMFMKFFGAKGHMREIEERLIHSAQLNDIKQTKLFKQLWDWGQLHSIDLF
jgi:hypothetical protein